jgi:hypothetical protein
MALRSLTRILSADKVIDGRALNVLGAQVFRTVAARAVHSLRPVSLNAEAASAVHELKREGVLVVPDFLSPAHFAAVLQECADLETRGSHALTDRQGPVVHTSIHVNDFGPALLPNVYAFFGDPFLRAILQRAEKWPFGDLADHGILERLSHSSAQPASRDPQSQLHSDIFFNSHKVWLFLDDVNAEDGPFAYVKQSHRLSLNALRAIYRESCRRDPASDRSRRIGQDEQRRMNVSELIVTCPRNTLLIANVCGYHRRLPGEAGRHRRALSLSLRCNPFLAHSFRRRLSKYARLYDSLRRAKRLLARR